RQKPPRLLLQAELTRDPLHTRQLWQSGAIQTTSPDILTVRVRCSSPHGPCRSSTPQGRSSRMSVQSSLFGCHVAHSQLETLLLPLRFCIHSTVRISVNERANNKMDIALAPRWFCDSICPKT